MSGSIQRLVATPLHAVAESNIGLAHMSFDFSLFKCEAPAELVPLGQQLSKARRESAEEGSFHILARRLGLLFENVLPDVPALLEAYGTRASEIVQQITQTEDKPSDICDGFFGTHLGIDSTTIWASATSGKPAFRMHLLACMLARIWSPQEATSIWKDLVRQRQEIIKKQAQAAEIADSYWALSATAHEIDRSSLASWDASARAWLQVADQARTKQQIQVKLIINNLSIGIKSSDDMDHSSASKMKFYDNVLSNFSRALSTLNKLVLGEPQRITDAGILLGLASWHLYPDLVVLGPSTKDIYQKDPLVKTGGIVTISISDHGSNADGVYWSLPLASLRYYGTVQRKRSTMHDSKVSVAQFQAMLLGASLGADEAALKAARILHFLWGKYHNLYQTALDHEANKPAYSKHDLELLHTVDIIRDSGFTLRQLMKTLHLLFPLKDGIELLSTEDESERKTANQLMRYGSSYGTSWVGNTDISTDCFFGLTNLSTVLQSAKHPSFRVEILRDICAEYLLRDSDYVIRFMTSNNRWAYASVAMDGRLATHGGLKRKRDQFEAQDGEEIQCLEIPPGEQWLCLPTPEASTDYQPQFHTPDVYEEIFAELLEDNVETVLFDFGFGVHNLAAVYMRRNRESSSRKEVFPSKIRLDLVENLLTMDMLRLDDLALSLLHHFEVDRPFHGKSLLALGRVVHYYNCHLPQATLSLGVIQSPLNSWKWTDPLVLELDQLSTLAVQQARQGSRPVSIYPSVLAREFAFAAILQFESGTIDVAVSDLIPVLAISSGNSLFIAEELIHDPIPSAEKRPRAISHVMGNVGKPGIALLVSPTNVTSESMILSDGSLSIMIGLMED